MDNNNWNVTETLSICVLCKLVTRLTVRHWRQTTTLKTCVSRQFTTLRQEVVKPISERLRVCGCWHIFFDKIVLLLVAQIIGFAQVFARFVGFAPFFFWFAHEARHFRKCDFAMSNASPVENKAALARRQQRQRRNIVRIFETYGDTFRMRLLSGQKQLYSTCSHLDRI